MEVQNSQKTFRTIYISHGGGPLPLLGDPSHKEMVAVLSEIASHLTRPEGILLVSAHWEELRPTVTGGRRPKLLYDYYGFPDDAYAISYPAPGFPELAAKVCRLLDVAGLRPVTDQSRGFDHGMFVPLKIMYPEADIPCIQLSLVGGLDPEEHIRIGESLAEIALENLLVIGSGFSFHNMREFFAGSGESGNTKNREFEGWLMETCSSIAIGEKDRRRKLIDWQAAPHARFCHPREEHLLPLHVCYGMNGGPCSEAFQVAILGKQASFYVW